MKFDLVIFWVFVSCFEFIFNEAFKYGRQSRMSLRTPYIGYWKSPHNNYKLQTSTIKSVEPALPINNSTYITHLPTSQLSHRTTRISLQSGLMSRVNSIVGRFLNLFVAPNPTYNGPNYGIEKQLRPTPRRKINGNELYTQKALEKSKNQTKVSKGKPECTKRYSKQPKCPEGKGYMQLGNSCYFVTEGYYENVQFSKDVSNCACRLLTDVNFATLGDWHLLTINSDNERNLLSTELRKMVASGEIKPQNLWISQAQLINDEHLFWEHACAGEITTSLFIGDNCETLTYDFLNNRVFTTCDESDRGIICELELDGKPYEFP